MTIDIVPAILAHTKEEFDNKLRLVEGQVPLVQIDVVDESFVPSSSYAVVEDVAAAHPTYDVDLHLMTREILRALSDWRRPWLGKITFHCEATNDPRRIIRAIHAQKVSAAIALNPETDAARVEPFLGEVESILFLGVPPGRGGQTFAGRVLGKIRAFHAVHPETVIGIDGGVTKELIPELIAAGASQLIIGSHLFDAKDPVAELQDLEKLVEEKGE